MRVEGRDKRKGQKGREINRDREGRDMRSGRKNEDSTDREAVSEGERESEQRDPESMR